jgi:DNA polymerase-1
MRDAAVDTETTGLRWDLDSRPFLVQTSDDDHPDGIHAYVGPARPKGVKAVDKRAFADAAWQMLNDAERVVGHNLQFDLHMLSTLTGNWDGALRGKPLLDTQYLAQIVLPQRRIAKEEDGRGYHLKDLSRQLVDPLAKDAEEELEKLAKEHGFRLKAKPEAKDYVKGAYYELWKYEPEAMEFYAREDVRLTLALLRNLESKLTEGTRNIWDLEQRVLPIVVGAEQVGIRVDAEKATPLRAQYVKEAEKTGRKLDKLLGKGWDENNEILADRLLAAGVPLTETTESGGFATNKWALERLKDDHPVIQTLFDHRQAAKFVSTYLDHFIDREIIHPNFKQIGTWTGRMAAVQPNMQNVPINAGKMIRELFVPRPGFAFVAIDYEQIEFRLLCYYLNGARMIELMESGHDPFAQLAADVYGGDPLTYRKGAVNEAKRTTTKNTTYAVIYGAGGLKVAKMLGWKPDAVYNSNDWVVQRGYKQVGDPRSIAAEQLIKKLKSALVGYGTRKTGLMGRIEQKVQRTGAVDTILGRHQWLGYDGGYKGLSGLIQGSAADIFKLGLIDSVEAVKDLGAYPLLFIHDEVVFETPIGTEKEVERLASKALVEAYPLRPHLQVESHIAFNNWGEAK